MFRVRRVLAAIAVLASMASGAIAADLERVDAKDGTSFMVVVGTLLPTENLDQKLAEKAAERPIAFATFNSPGGSPYAAMRLGRTIRRLGLNTVQLKAFECASACTLAFVGGANRFAEAGAIGVHKASFSNPDAFGSEDAVSFIQKLTGDIIGYLIEMGVDPGLMQVALSYDANDMRYLSSSEMEKFRVTTNSAMPPQEEVTVAAPAQSVAPPNLETGKPHGWVRHPSGGIVLKSAPDEKSADSGPAWNTTPVEVIGLDGHWLKVRAGGSEGYAHETWIKVAGYASSTDDRKYVQVFSFPNMEAARAKMRSLPYRTDAYETPNGWVAVTLAGKFSEDDAKAALQARRKDAGFPDDAFRTFGNTYKRKLCCD